MSERRFEMRLNARYQDPDNSVASLEVDIMGEQGWQPLNLNALSPGFQIFTYAVFTCQHLYMRSNCAERGLMLKSAEGSIELLTDEVWKMTRLHVGFDALLKTGDPTEADIDYITGRMGQCPVSRNIIAPADIEAVLTFI